MAEISGMSLAQLAQLGAEMRLLQVVNPPLFGVLCGIGIGLTPLGVLLFQANSQNAVAALHHLPFELQACIGKRPQTDPTRKTSLP